MSTPVDVKCRFCSASAIAKYAMDRGCVCFPDDREQALCAQHIIRATPLGSMELLEDYTLEKVIERGLWPS
jgi:hypothetical protein